VDTLGKVAEWNEERGFGFIQPLQASAARVFFHIRDYRQDGRRPQPGELVRYSARRQDDGRWRADSVRRAVAPPGRQQRVRAQAPGRDAGALAWGVLVAHLAGLGWALHAQRLVPLAALALLALSCLTAAAYAIDKRAARLGLWRIPESQLHLLELLGGWPGAILAQRLLRHKTRKTAYQVLFWLAVLGNATVFWGWLSGRF
jgi:uncharacterized membrane protein YsdA (DUF1294 family)/cold shock CspA family protein